MLHEIKVPVKPHILKYLQYHLPHPYKPSENDFVGSTILQMLRRPENHAGCAKLVERMQHHWVIELTDRDIDRGRMHMGSQNTMSFNTYIDKVIDIEMYMTVNRMYDRGFEKNQAILDFMADYNIHESEMSFDALKKRYQRVGYNRRKNNLK